MALWRGLTALCMRPLPHKTTVSCLSLPSFKALLCISSMYLSLPSFLLPLFFYHLLPISQLSPFPVFSSYMYLPVISLTLFYSPSLPFHWSSPSFTSSFYPMFTPLSYHSFAPISLWLFPPSSLSLFPAIPPSLQYLLFLLPPDTLCGLNIARLTAECLGLQHFVSLNN